MSQSELSNSPISDNSDTVGSKAVSEAALAAAGTAAIVEPPAMEQAGAPASDAADRSAASNQEIPAAEHSAVEAMAEQVTRLLAQLQMQARGWLTGLRLPPSPRTMRMLVVVGSSAILLMLLPALLNGSHNPAGAERALPTPTVVPTATPLPSPTAMVGYQPLVDSEDGFVIQYPLDWSCSPINPGVDCIDSPDARKYDLQVQVPGGWTGANTGKDPNDASVWVNYTLKAFDLPGRTVERLPEDTQPVTIGGVTWQSGAEVIIESATDSSDATVTPDATATPTRPPVRTRVQIYATVYNGKPYIIALFAADAHFATGAQHYFQPMLNSFSFLPRGSDK